MAFFGFTKLTSGCLTYWHRPPTPAASGSDQPPVVFCHGLGVGVISYITVVQSLVCKGPGRRLIMVELPHISMRPVETQASPRELVASIADMLGAHACLPVGAHFVGHSFGSVGSHGARVRQGRMAHEEGGSTVCAAAKRGVIAGSC